ncbi:hypothetical protein [Agarivorans sp. DSG3-1]|uniref:hypothetical protein n=1 Tax=Agarivorans sp. DSG3-1 TaxID=3342249 RepID=UPI00398F6D9F
MPVFTKVPLLFLFLVFSTTSFANEDSSLAIDNSSVIMSDYKDSVWVSVVGEIKNSGTYPVEDVILEIRFFDDKGNLIDAITESLYSIVIPRNDSVVFKLGTSATMPEESYSSHKVRVISSYGNYPSGSCDSSSVPQKTDNRWKKLLISWSPMLLLIAVWVLLARRYSGRKSPQQKMVNLMEQQVETGEQTKSDIQRLADAAEQLAKSSIDKST